MLLLCQREIWSFLIVKGTHIKILPFKEMSKILCKPSDANHFNAVPFGSKDQHLSLGDLVGDLSAAAAARAVLRRSRMCLGIVHVLFCTFMDVQGGGEGGLNYTYIDHLESVFHFPYFPFFGLLCLEIDKDI